MTTLGIGTPVRIGWAPDSQKRCYRQDPRMRPGIIIDGPVHVDPAVELVSDIFGELTIVKYRATYWLVDVGGVATVADERYLIPDDGETEADLARRGMAVET